MFLEGPATHSDALNQAGGLDSLFIDGKGQVHFQGRRKLRENSHNRDHQRHAEPVEGRLFERDR